MGNLFEMLLIIVDDESLFRIAHDNYRSKKSYFDHGSYERGKYYLSLDQVFGFEVYVSSL